MAQKGKYCKAYSLAKLRMFDGWSEDAQNIRKERREVNGQEVETQRELADSDYLYLQENFTVTDDIFIDENIIFADVTPEWMDFCENALKFEAPVYETVGSESRHAE
jgi:hypothetical protein